MSAFGATLKREAVQSLVGGRAWSFAAAIAVLTGLPLLALADARTGMADFAPSLSVGAWGALVAGALLGASSVSSERRQGTWDLVLAAPGRPAATIWGKACALGVAAAVLCAGLPVQAIVESRTVSVDPAAVCSGVFAMWLLAAASGAVGLLCACVVRSGLAAIALSLLVVGGWVSVVRSMQVYGDPWYAATGYALDPIRRVQECANGAFDLGSVLALAAAWACCAWMAARWADAERRAARAPAWRRRLVALGIGLASLVMAGVALRGPGVEPPRVDLHRVLAIEATPRLQQAVREASGPVHFTLLVAKGLGEPAAAAARQAVERAVACRDASNARPAMSEVDLLSPMQVGAAAQAVERIEAADATATRAWREAFSAGLATLESVSNSADLAGVVSQTATRRSQGDVTVGNLPTVAAAMQRAVAEGRAWREAFEGAAASTPDRPLGDLEGAGRALGAEMGVWAKLLREGADALAAPGATREQREAARRLGALSDRCRSAQDALDRLPPLRLTEVAAALRAPPVLVVTTARGCAAIPAWRLMEGAAAADEALADTLAAAQGAPRSGVVFVHAQQRSPLEPTPSGGDLAFAADALRAARLRVEAWNPLQSPRPSARDAKRRAWVIVPPLERRSLEPDAGEQAVLEAAQRLVREGEPVFVLAAPSVAASMGMADPWASLLRGQGLEVRSEAAVVQLAARSESARELRTRIEEIRGGEHAVGAGLRGRVQWPMALPLRLQPNSAWRDTVVAQVDPLPSMWIEEDPRVVSKGADAVPAGKGLKEGEVVPVLAVAEGEGRRAALAGGLAWALSASAGLADARGSLLYPGNRALLVGTVRWLVGEEVVGAGEPALQRGRGLYAVAWLPAALLVGARIGVRAWRRRA